MKHLTLITLIALTLIAGCQMSLSLTQRDVDGGDIHAAISQGLPAEHIDSLLSQTANPAQAANSGIMEIMNIGYLPQDIGKYWQYYQPKPMRQTPSIEILEVINRYKITILDVLVRHGGNLNRKRKDGSPCIRVSDNMTPELLAWLLDHGYDANMTDKSNPDYSGLDFCAHPGQSMLRYDQKYEMIKMLLKHGANPNVSSLGQPILHTLATYHRDNPYAPEIIELLLKAGADPTVKHRGQTGLTAVELAFGHDKGEIAMAFLKNIETIDSPDLSSTPLIYLAAAHNNPQCLELLLSRGVSINTVNSEANTPLHAAVASGNEEIVKMLLDSGAKVNAVNEEGQTPLDKADNFTTCRPDAEPDTQKQRLIKLLTQHGAKRAAELKETNA